MSFAATRQSPDIDIQVGDISLKGILSLPDEACGLVLFAHGSGSSRHSTRNQYVAGKLNEHNLATLLFDLLTDEEEVIDTRTLELRFNIELLGVRMINTVDWINSQESIAGLPVGLFGASTGAAAALLAAAARNEQVKAVVSRGGRADLANKVLPQVTAPTLLIVGEKDAPVIEMNRTAAERLQVTHELAIVSGATHLFSEAGALEQVAELAQQWFSRYLCGR